MSEKFILHPVWWLWIPGIFMVIQTGLEIFLPGALLSALHSENGPHESLQFFVILGALGVAVSTLLRLNWKTQKALGGWLALAAICCAYVAGEEISWGQHILEWSTPEFWAQVNDQGETNLHNTSSWLDQKPRLLLMIGIVVGGLVIPALQKYRPALLPAKFEVIYPPKELALIAAFVIVPKIAESSFELFGIRLFERFSEVQELYMFYFVLLYLIALRKRVDSQVSLQK